MSAFLGPIHHWLYNKITIQHNIVEDIILIDENKDLDLRNKLYREFGDSEIKPLEEIIDVSNIHGWLQKKVALEESRLAYAVTAIINDNPNMLGTLKDLFRNIGENISTLSKNDEINDVYKAINDTLLDGMPCDNVNTIISQEDDSIIWKRNLCVHKDYWDSVNGDIDNYYLLRDEFISGMLKKTNIAYEKLNEVTSKISRR